MSRLKPGEARLIRAWPQLETAAVESWYYMVLHSKTDMDMEVAERLRHGIERHRPIA
jgi:hypothetical protein